MIPPIFINNFMEFNKSHIFDLSGKVLQGRPHQNHDHILDQSNFRQGTMFIHGTVGTSQEGPVTYTHYLNLSKNEPSGDAGYTHISERGKVKHYAAALKTLLNHYSKNSGRRFKINIHLGDFADSNHPIAKRYLKTLGKTIDDDYITLSSTDEIKKFLSGKKNSNTKQIPTSRDIDSSRLGREPSRMSQGSMTKAEYDFWRRKNLGDSYNPIMSFKEYIIETL